MLNVVMTYRINTFVSKLALGFLALVGVSCHKEPVGPGENGQTPVVEVIEFADSNVKNLCVRNWDTDGDGQLSFQEAAAVTDLSDVFYNSDIDSFNELRYFTGLTEICSNAFLRSSLSEITLPEGLKSIGRSAFGYCRNLSEIVIPDSVTDIGKEAFRHCTTLYKVICYAVNPPKAGYDMFLDCDPELKIILLGQSLSAYTSALNWKKYQARFEGDFNVPIVFADDKVREICDQQMWDKDGDDKISYTEAAAVTDLGSAFSGSDITSFNELRYFTGLTSISESAFSKCELLEEIIIPEGVGSIGPEAFAFCSSLKSIELPEELTAISTGVFFHCVNLSSVTLGDKIKWIGRVAFASCESLETITFSDRLNDISSGAFRDCKALKSIYFKSSSVPTGDNEMFFNHAEGRKIYVPYESIGNYIKATYWNTYAQDIVAYDYASGKPVETISFYDGWTEKICLTNFDKNSDGILTSIEAAAVTDIGQLFKDSAILRFDEFKYFTGIKSIPAEAFNSCADLQTITIPSGVTSIDKTAFKYCFALTEFKGKFASADGRCLVINGVLEFCAFGELTTYTTPPGVTAIGDYAFSESSDLKSVTVSSGVKSIGKEAFYWNQETLESVILPEGLTKIGDSAFSTTRLATITLPSTLTSIGVDAFVGNTYLKSVYCKAVTPPTVGKDAFYDLSDDLKIYVPKTSETAYRSAEYWESMTIIGY